MTWTYTFGGQSAQPAQVSQTEFTLSADTTLAWPWVDQDAVSSTALIMDVTATSGSLKLLMPPATGASTGQTILVFNAGSNAFTVSKNDGTPIVTITASLAYYIYITDNSTDAGDWRYIQFGAGASSVDAAALDGYGLKAMSSVLNQDHPVTVIITSTTINSAYRAQLVSVSPAVGSGTITLPTVASATDGFFFLFNNLGSGAWSVVPNGSEKIDNSASIVVNPNESCEIHCGATGWYTIGRGRSSTYAFTMLNLDVSAGGTITLTTTEAANFIQRYFGALPNNTTIIVPNAVQPYIVYNNTTAAFTLQVKTAAGTGLTITQSERTWLYCDGTNVLDADTAAGGAPSLSMPDGTEAAPGLAFTNDVNTGIYAPASGSDRIGFTASGQQRAEINTSGLNVVRGGLFWASADFMAVASVLG